MKKILFLVGVMCIGNAFSQTTLFSDDFETGTSTAWTLNAGTGGNQWIVNDSYTGYAPLIQDTPDQPVGIIGGPQSYYMHIHNISIVGPPFNLSNANFDTGTASNQNATMANPISTVGMSSTTITFWYLCAGAAVTAQGKLQYSTDGGTSWTDAGTYVNVSTWTQETVTLPAFDNQASLLFRFNWQNSGPSGADPAFSVDEIKITAMGSSSTITGLFVTDSIWCFNAEEAFTVNINALGTFNAGNVFSAELSDASGSFASPTVIGTLNSTSNGALSINCTIPLGTIAGGGYLIRVSSSDPAVTSANNGSNLKVQAIPVVSAGVDTTVCVGSTLILAGTGAAAYSWDNSITNNVPFTPVAGTTIYTVTGTGAGGCLATDQVAVTAENCAGIETYKNTAKIAIYPNPADEYIVVKGLENIKTIKILDLTGRVVKVFDLNSTGEYSVSELGEGSYFVTVTSNKEAYAKKIIIH